MCNSYNNRTKVLVAMSGGVDSAVAALMLKQQGFDCVGVMMRLHDMPNLHEEIVGFERVCEHLKIPAQVLDMRREFKTEIIDYFVESYAAAQTPNPCVVCNQKMKFGALRQIADKTNCNYIATGHYAQICHDDNEYPNDNKTTQQNTNENNQKYNSHKLPEWRLCCGKDPAKDQSYFLHVIKRTDLPRILFPLGTMSKTDVRKIAAENHLPCAKKSESQDICFIEDGKYREFLNTAGVHDNPGKIVDTKGQVLGRHEGLCNYTIGQRKGLVVAVGKPAYVCKIDRAKNEVVLGSREDALVTSVNVSNMNWLIDMDKFKNGSIIQCQAKLRYRQKPAPCTVTITNNAASDICITLDTPAFAPAAGQFAVLYNNETVLGGGTIQ